MSTRQFAFLPGNFYHVYNRGNSKQNIFHDPYDYKRFLALLFVSNSAEAFKLYFVKEPYELERGQRLVAVGAYCLMPNHFHILLTPLVEKGVSIFMKKVMTGYSMYFNNRYERTGGLYEGRFKARMASDDVYLKYLYAYIHLNPIKLIQSDWKERGIVDVKTAKSYLNGYEYSSYLDCVGQYRKEQGIIDQKPFPQYFESTKDFERNIFEWFEQNKQVRPV